MRECKKHNCTNNDQNSEVNLHHLIPRCCFPKEFSKGKRYDMFGEKGNRVTLCKSCHDKIHKIIFSVLWQCVPESEKGVVMKKLFEFTERWVKEGY